MRAKHFNTSNPAFTHGWIMSETQRGSTGVYFRVNHDGEKFVLTEAYMSVSKIAQEGSVAEMLPFLNEVTNEWFNAQLEGLEESIVARGLVSIVGNFEYRAEQQEVEKIVAKMKTKRERRHIEIARLKELHRSKRAV